MLALFDNWLQRQVIAFVLLLVAIVAALGWGAFFYRDTRKKGVGRVPAAAVPVTIMVMAVTFAAGILWIAESDADYRLRRQAFADRLQSAQSEYAWATAEQRRPDNGPRVLRATYPNGCVIEFDILSLEIDEAELGVHGTPLAGPPSKMSAVGAEICALAP